MQLIKFILPFLVWQSSIYSFTLTDIQGRPLPLSQFAGKPLLIVNIATGHPGYAAQLGELRDLQAAYDTNLVVLAFPSNSFGHESRSAADIALFCTSVYATNFRIMEPASVRGAARHPLYSWLAAGTENGRLGVELQDDFQKVFIDKSGQICGVFAGEVSPGDTAIQSLIEQLLIP